jgi:hypothetical protein
MSFHLGSRPSGNQPWAVFNAEFPSAFTDSQWLVNQGFGEGEVNVIVITTPASGGLLIQDIEYRIDGGSPVSLNAKSSGVYTISGFEIDQELDIELRIVTRKGAGAWSDAKELTIVDFNPASLFLAAGTTGWVYPEEPGVTLFQDSAGTIPVVNPGDPVGLSLDTSKGLVLGPELVTNGTFDENVNGWTPVGSGTFVWSNGAGVFTRVVDGNDGVRQSFPTVSGRHYRVSVTVTAGSSARIEFNSSGNPFPGNIVSNGGVGTYTVILAATSSTMFVALGRASNGTVTYDNITVRELPGVHAFQTTALNRPIYGRHPVTGIRNLLTFTEQFDNAAWGKTRVTVTADATVAPDGVTTADRLVGTPAAGDKTTFLVGRTVTNAAHTWTLRAKYDNLQWIAINAFDGSNNYTYFDILNGVVGVTESGVTASIASIGDGWYLCRVSRTTAASVNAGVGIHLASANGALSFTSATGGEAAFIWGAQLELGSTATAYQRVGNTFDVTEAGVASVNYLSHNGTNQWLTTSSFAWGSDKATITAGVRKLSDAGAIVEASGNSEIAAGAFSLWAQNYLTSGAQRFAFLSKGSGTPRTAESATSFAAPVTSVVSGIGDIAGPSSALRINGAQVAQNLSTQGTGNYGTYPLFFGARNGGANFLNGRRYPSVGINTLLTAAQLAQVEAWVTARTGALG